MNWKVATEGQNKPCIWGCAVLWIACIGSPANASEPPKSLPRYDLDVHINVDRHLVKVREVVTWTNRSRTETDRLVFNFYSHFKLPDKDVGVTAKIVEILRMSPGEAIDFEGNAGNVECVKILNGEELEHFYMPENQTALVVPLPKPVKPCESVTVHLEFQLNLPNKQGRWGQWEGVMFMCHWHPMLAYYDDCGWQPTPFVPWHQPFFNEAGIYTARITLPCDQKLACTGPVIGEKKLGDGWKQIEIGPRPARDFAILCSARYCEYVGEVDGITVRCVAFPEHEYYAKKMVKIACEAIHTYNRWFGPYPYAEFSIVESYFGWNGNECSGVLMIDERIFAMPHVAERYVDYLVTHETCHQWFYNTIGTNGYCETWMDEGLATYFSNRLITQKCGRNAEIIQFPKGLKWMPNIRRENYRYFGLYGTLGRGEESAVIQEMGKFGHIVNLFSMCYDKGSKIVGMIEDRLGEAAFFDFMRMIYRKYYFRVLRVADFQRELEEYTGRSWEDFFQTWLHSKGLTDWCIEKVDVSHNGRKVWGPRLQSWKGRQQECEVTVYLHQKAEFDEPTTLGFALENGEHFQLRVPVAPAAEHLEFDNPPGTMTTLPDHRVRVEVRLPCIPKQIAVDPDQILVDRNPANNFWKPRCRFDFTPLYTQLNDTDLAADYDKWNFTAGPWIYASTYWDPWFTRSSTAGIRAGVYRTQFFSGGVYLGYRTDFQDFAVGADALWNHCPFPHTQIGILAEQSLTNWESGDRRNDRAVLFGRYVLQYGSALYLQPMEYVELFTAVQNNVLPNPRESAPGSVRIDHSSMVGLHYHVNYLTPYWDAEGGYLFDMTYANGFPVRATEQTFYRLDAQLSAVKSMPSGWGYLSETRWVARAYGAGALPNDGNYFTLGGWQRFRGYDLAQRQGAIMWIGTLEWRLPIIRRAQLDCCDHIARLRGIYLAPFYDAGDVYVNNRQVGDGIAHAVGCGLCFEMEWFSFVERSMIRVDVAKTINDSTPTQVWFGFSHPF